MRHQPTAHLPLPDLQFVGEGEVRSEAFGDVYFSRHDGVAETKHVFLAGNGLPERWKDRAAFTIGELGFGTGLNFLLAWQAFLETNPQGHLHYISVEKYPLGQAQWAQLMQLAPEIYKTVFPHEVWRLPGWHRVQLERCTLTLGFGDAEDLLKDAGMQVDAWFLDGFAPAKNAEMWSESLLGHIGRLTAPGGSFATFTAAGAVKRGLQAVGFAVQKVRGFGHKRDMLIGTRPGATAGGKPGPEQVVVIGAGIAGATVARALAERGTKVMVLERERVACGASGNAAGVLYPQLTKYYIPATAWHATGNALMLRQLARWRSEGLPFTWQQPGMLRLPREGDAASMLQSLQLDETIARHVTAPEASAIAGMPIAQDAVYLPQGSWVAPAELCRALLQHPNITLREGCAATAITRTVHGWEVQTAQGAVPTAALVVCNAAAAQALLPDAPLPMGRTAGQVTLATLKGEAPRCIVSHRGYIVPLEGQCLIGATYARGADAEAVTQAGHDENLQHARDALGDWADGLAVQEGRVSFRATTPDRLPYVGALEEGLYVSLGHGSRGMISAPLAAEVIAAQLHGELVPLTAALQAAINPKRRAA